MTTPRRPPLTEEDKADKARLKEAIGLARPQWEKKHGRKLTQAVIGEEAGLRMRDEALTQGAVYQYLSANSDTKLNPLFVQACAAAFDFDIKSVSERFLPITNERADTAGNVSAPNVDGDARPVKEGSVPVVGMAKLGADGFFEAIDYPTGHGDGRVLISSNDPNAYALRVVGDSMEPRIRNGEFVLIEPNKAYVAGDEVMVQFTDGAATQSMIKVFMYDRDGFVRLLSVNDAHPPATIEKSKILKIHPVGAILKPSRYVAG